MNPSLKIVLSGSIGCGKSTVVRHVMEQRPAWRRPGGFFTLRQPGAIIMRTWEGEERIVARHSATPQRGRPPYDVDLDAFNRFGSRALRPSSAAQPFVLDELGLLELPAQAFARAIADLFHGPNPLIAVIQHRSLEPWMGLIGKEYVHHLLMVTADNRDDLPGGLLDLLK